jgi:hypothetical protein
VGELIKALQTSVPNLRTRWACDAAVQLNFVRGAHWLDDIWATVGIPRLYVLLEEVAMNRIEHEDVPDFGAHVSKLLYVNEVMSRLRRKEIGLGASSRTLERATRVDTP